MTPAQRRDKGEDAVGETFPVAGDNAQLRYEAFDNDSGPSESFHARKGIVERDAMMVQGLRRRFILQAPARPRKSQSPLDIFPSVEGNILPESVFPCDARRDADMARVCEAVLDRNREKPVRITRDFRITELPSGPLQPPHGGRDPD